MSEYMLDEDAMAAATDLVGRTGAKNLQVGYLHDDVPASEAGWYAKATYRGDRIIVEDKAGPQEALEALAHRLLQGARCTHCRRRVRLDSKPGCRWRRFGPRWYRGCENHPVWGDE